MAKAKRKIKEKDDKDVTAKTRDDSQHNEEILNTIRLYKTESEDSRETRTRLNDRNWAAYFSRQDWSHKKAGQSREFAPHTSIAVESATSFIKRSLTGFGNYFSMDLINNQIMTDRQAHDLLRFHLDDEKTDFTSVIGDSIKIMLLSSVVTYKVRHEVKSDEFILKIDAEKPERIYPDPTGRELYTIHETIRDLHEVEALAKKGVYDKEEVAKIKTDFVERDKEWRDERQRNHNHPLPNFRKRVTLHEIHGTIVSQTGEVLEKGIIATMANNKYLIRKARKNPRFHGKWPFVRASIIKIPGSVWHKALFDDAVRINLYINELQNLMLDGGLAAAHDVKMLRQEYLLKPEQAANGVRPGETLLVKGDMPANVKLMETVKTGEVPADSFNLHTMGIKDFQMSSLSSEIRLGALPERQVKATEVIEKEQNISGQLDGFARTVETSIDMSLRLAWAEIMQFRNDYSDVEHIIGEKAAFALTFMPARQRYDMFAKKTKFKVNGISSLITRGRNFQKLMVVVDTAFKNPILANAFAKEYSPKKIIDKMFEGVDLDPSSIRLDKGEEGIQPQEIEQLFGGQKTGADAAQAGGRNALPADRFPAGKTKETLQ